MHLFSFAAVRAGQQDLAICQRLWPCLMRSQAFSQPPDLRNLSCSDSVPQGNLQRESIHHYSPLAYQHTLSRWENWIRRIVLSELLQSSVTARNRTRTLHCHVTTCMSGATVNNVLWKCQEDILSRLKSRNLCRSWRPNNAVMKEKNLCIFFISTGLGSIQWFLALKGK